MVGNKNKRVIVAATAAIVFSLFSTFSGTVAWFAASQTYSAEVGAFSIDTPPGISVDLYYLDHFEEIVDETPVRFNGNLNPSLHAFSGYHVAHEGAIFERTSNYVPFASESPVSVDELWPAHRLTFAAVITSGVAKNFNLLECDGGISSSIYALTHDAETDEDILSPVSLLWAIDIKGKCYFADTPEDAYEDYRRDYDGLDDCCDVVEGEKASFPQSIASGVAAGSGAYQIFLFSIEFSNSPETFYSPIEYQETPTPVESRDYVEEDSATGNSNCYENLTLAHLSFELE